MKPVAIRPIDKKYGNKTYLGFFLGDYILEINMLDGSKLIPHGDETEESMKKKIVILASNNPAIFVPEFKKVIWGAESYWGFIEDEAKLREITNKDINDVWYNQALRQMKEE